MIALPLIKCPAWLMVFVLALLVGSVILLFSQGTEAKSQENCKIELVGQKQEIAMPSHGIRVYNVRFNHQGFIIATYGSQIAITKE